MDLAMLAVEQRSAVGFANRAVDMGPVAVVFVVLVETHVE